MMWRNLSLSLRFEKVMDEREASQMNVLQLAYLGDSVWETIIRYDMILKKLNVHHLHEQSVKQVNAAAQAEIEFEGLNPGKGHTCSNRAFAGFVFDMISIESVMAVNGCKRGVEFSFPVERLHRIMLLINCPPLYMLTGRQTIL